MVKSFIKAARLRTLPLSISGIIVGGFLAESHNKFDWPIFILSILTTVGFQIISNFANDYGDGVKGTDNKNRIGPERTLQSGELSRNQLLNAIKVAIIITLLIAIALIYRSFGKDDFINILLFFSLGVASIWAAIKYTMGKNAYGYIGLGDVFVFLFFGLLSVCGSYFLYTKQLSFDIFFPAFSIGLLSAAVLNLNNMRDRASDILAGKKTLVVKIGAEFAKYYHYYLLFASFLFALLYAVINYTSWYNFIFLLAFIPITTHFYTVYNNEDAKLLDPELKKLAISTLLFSILFGLGFVL
jgi:1,4-dihydroxy-2-naphthoate octaprenyltransferase